MDHFYAASFLLPHLPWDFLSVSRTKQGDKYLSHIHLLSFSPEKCVQRGREKDVCFIHGLESRIIWFAKDFVLVKVTEQFETALVKFCLLPKKLFCAGRILLC